MRRVRSVSVMFVALGVVVGSGGGAAAQGETVSDQLPILFTGHIDCGPDNEVRSERFETADGVVRSRGGAWKADSATMSDPRLEGEYYLSLESDTYTSPAGKAVIAGTWRIENHEGAWQGSYIQVGLGYEDNSIVTTPLVGEGAYEGLTAVWESRSTPACTWEVRGMIIEGDVPAAPEPFTGQGH